MGRVINVLKLPLRPNHPVTVILFLLIVVGVLAICMVVGNRPIPPFWKVVTLAATVIPMLAFTEANMSHEDVR